MWRKNPGLIPFSERAHPPIQKICCLVDVDLAVLSEVDLFFLFFWAFVIVGHHLVSPDESMLQREPFCPRGSLNWVPCRRALLASRSANGSGGFSECQQKRTYYPFATTLVAILPEHENARKAPDRLLVRGLSSRTGVVRGVLLEVVRRTEEGFGAHNRVYRAMGQLARMYGTTARQRPPCHPLRGNPSQNPRPRYRIPPL